MIIILTTVPDETLGRTIAQKLVSDRLAACVHILPPHTALYRWDGKVEEGREHNLLIKTADDKFDAVATAIKSLHPYDVPSILALPVDAVDAAFGAWVTDSTSPAT